jgi:hypothetical protein
VPFAREVRAVGREPREADRAPDPHASRGSTSQIDVLAEVARLRVIRLCMAIACGEWLIAMSTGRPIASSMPELAPAAAGEVVDHELVRDRSRPRRSRG